jgi:hypothetical protein
MGTTRTKWRFLIQWNSCSFSFPLLYHKLNKFSRYGYAKGIAGGVLALLLHVRAAGPRFLIANWLKQFHRPPRTGDPFLDDLASNKSYKKTYGNPIKIKNKLYRDILKEIPIIYISFTPEL